MTQQNTLQQDKLVTAENGTPQWLRGYWGKTNRRAGEDLRYHLLAYHNLDVAASAQVILEHDGRLRMWLAQKLGVKAERLIPFVTFLIALHDIGKFAEAFQNVNGELFRKLQGRKDAREYTVYHDTLGYLLWRDVLHEALIGKDGLDVGRFDRDADDDDWWDYFDPIAQAVTGHHGTPPNYGNQAARKHFGEEAKEAALAYVRALTDLLKPEQALVEGWTYDVQVPAVKQASWVLAGLTVLADWIGSNAAPQGEPAYFAFRQDELGLADYWPIARKQAEEAVSRSGVIAPAPADQAQLDAIFPKLKDASPTPLQAYAQTCDVQGQQLFILEDATGSGKTEAALVLALRIMQAGGGSGLYLGLPTMATANAMLERLLDPEDGRHPYRHLFAEPDGASLVLAHSRRDQHGLFRGFRVQDASEAYKDGQGGRAKADLTGQAQCAAWLADSRKKALLASVGVGTIDQALLGVLPSRHQSLRLLGLGRNVLIVDEVHAYDEYVSGLLRHLIAFQAALGGSVIVLSATLPRALRQKLCDAFRDGLELPRLPVEEDSFPLATRVSPAQKIEETPVQPRPGFERSVDISFIHDENAVRERLLAIASAGGCACWIRNTVDEAVAAYASLKEEGAKVTLFHARFALADRLKTEQEVLEMFGERSTPEDRKGRILVATQVVEQSLDLDFDGMVSDLAPIDLLIQRAGRLHRHERSGRPAEAATSRLDVLTPALVEDPPEDWFSATFPQAQYVYPHVGVLWRTAHVLSERRRIAVPEEARMLLERVYDDGRPDAPPVPPNLEKASNTAFNEMKLARAQANHNALHLAGGYGSLKAGAARWFDDTRTPTRLGEPTTTVRLGKMVGDRVLPWADGDDAWQRSEVSVRERRLASGPDWEKMAAQKKDDDVRNMGAAALEALKAMPDYTGPLFSDHRLSNISDLEAGPTTPMNPCPNASSTRPNSKPRSPSKPSRASNRRACWPPASASTPQ